jgi:hypothetical protein
MSLRLIKGGAQQNSNGRVLKDGQYTPHEPRKLDKGPAIDPAIESLKNNLQTLNSLHAKLKHMIEELRELVRE